MPHRLRHDRTHDYPHLIQHWKSVAKAAGLTLEKYGEAGGFDLFFLRSKKIKDGVPAIYFSAGIHGDEPAGTEGLLTWAKKNATLVKKLNVLIFPCLNPWGLTNNSRRDAEGRDLNRSFRTTNVPQIVWQMALMANQAFDLALTLHEDYDGQGVYIYEIDRHKPYWGETLLRACKKWIAPDPRRVIETRGARNGIVRRTITPDSMPDWPEAFVLYFQKVTRVFTVETPSEFNLDDRVAAQVAIISKAVSLCRKEFSLPRRPSAP